MDFKSYLELSARQIDEELDLILLEFLSEVKKTNIKLLPFALGFLNSCKGGKRIRGVLVKLGYEIADGKPNVDIMKVAAAFEILHTGLLIHDDIVDKSPTRRGQQALYKVLGGGYYGISQAIILGDIGLYLPIKIIADSNFLGEYKIKALSYLSQTMVNTGWGQILDVEGSKEDIEFIRLYKTGKYTIAGSLQIGAILAGVDEKLLGLLGLFGEDLGVAFQIQDDILDKEVEAADEVKIQALEYITKAKKVIPSLTKVSKMSKLLEQMAEYIVERRK